MDTEEELEQAEAFSCCGMELRVRCGRLHRSQEIMGRTFRRQEQMEFISLLKRCRLGWGMWVTNLEEVNAMRWKFHF